MDIHDITVIDQHSLHSEYLLCSYVLVQLKEKRRQTFLKTTTEGRQRAKQKRIEEELERERKIQEDEERRL